MRSCISYLFIIAAVSGMTMAVRAQDDVATEAVALETPEVSVEGLGMTHGSFAMLVIHEARAERLFSATVTARGAAEALGSIGLSPEGGWRVTQELTRPDLESAFRRLMVSVEVAKTEPPVPVEEEDVDAVADAADADDATEENTDDDSAAEADISNLTIAELIDTIVGVAKKAFAQIDVERMPVSPTGASWQF